MKKLIITKKIYEDILHRYGSQQRVTIDNDTGIATKYPNMFYNKHELQKIEIMKKYPQFFAKIFSYSKEETQQETLNSDKFIKDLTEFTNEIETHQEKDYANYMFDAIGRLDNIINDIYFDNEDLKQLAVHLPKSLFDFYKKLRTLIQNFKKIEEASDIEFDLHSYQFGYDKQNNIKAFDI